MGAPSRLPVYLTQITTAQAPRTGTAAAAYGFTGSAAGDRDPRGSSSSAYSIAGTASGRRSATGGASGTQSITGAAVGRQTARGTASGTQTVSGAATGQRTARGTASDACGYAGAAAGRRAPRAASEGVWSHAGAAAGARRPRATCAVNYGFTVTAAGTAPGVGPPGQGTAAGTCTYTAAAIGITTRSGTSWGAWAYAGDATGPSTPGVVLTATVRASRARGSLSAPQIYARVRAHAAQGRVR